jgi:hypothetical protein
MNIERYLRNQAQSYWRDSEKLDGIERTAYRTISAELHKVADQLRLDLADAPAGKAGDL